MELFTLRIVAVVTIANVGLILNLSALYLVLSYMKSKVPQRKNVVPVVPVHPVNVKQAIHDGYMKAIKKNAGMIEKQASEDIDSMMDGFAIGTML